MLEVLGRVERGLAGTVGAVHQQVAAFEIQREISEHLKVSDLVNSTSKRTTFG